MKAFAQRLLLSRRDLGWKQDALAERAGVSRAYISDLERGKITNPTLDVIQALADALGIRPEYLTGWSDDPLGEGAVVEGRVSVDIQDDQARRRIEALIDEFMSLPAQDQELALNLIRQVGRSNRARVIGG